MIAKLFKSLLILNILKMSQSFSSRRRRPGLSFPIALELITTRSLRMISPMLPLLPAKRIQEVPRPVQLMQPLSLSLLSEHQKFTYSEQNLKVNQVIKK
jgi:hypothetical protein